ncbi:hypothetical protein GMLC_26240 [Geomonas limicola]|uniref:Oxygen sensor histidine kinase NreB n=1 Tax=Geomonas limicola TaxID=2740186 RepID=A0A6V8N8Y6_9BACT|nr:PAS domain-containing protein [Geomonas limicola]GFO69045.1 hypothetical protein GMLC_26240 [Geomonas limicola]
MLCHHVPISYLVLDTEGKVLKSSYATAELLGVHRLHLVQVPFSDFVLEECRPLFLALIRQIFAEPGAPVTCELVLCTAAQQPLQVQLQAQVRDPGNICLVTLTDVSSLRASPTFETAADHALAWEFWVGPDGRFIYVSPACQALTGYPAEEFLADPELFVRIVHPEDTPPFFPSDLVQYRPEPLPREYRIVHRDGSVLWMRYEGQLVTGPDQGILGLKGNNREVTHERQLRQQLEQSVEELKKLTEELNLSEERERRRIAQALHDQVVQGLALGKLNLETVLLKGEIADHPVLQELKSILEYSIQDLRDLCFDLSSPLLYDLGLESAIGFLGEKLEQKFGYHFIFNTWARDKKPLGEEIAVAMYQFCRELLINAGKHAQASQVTCLLYQDEQRLILNLQDDGKGFDPERYQEGFGLPSIRQRVNYLGGTLTVKSKAGAGTTTEITLWLAKQSAKETL